MVKAGTHTQEQAAVAVGVSQPAVSKAIRNITEKAVTAKKVISPPQPTIKLAKDPALTAKNIKAKMGEEYAARLGDVSGMQTQAAEEGKAATKKVTKISLHRNGLNRRRCRWNKGWID